MVLPTQESGTVIVPGDPEQLYTCITSDTRPFQWHAWLRAESHIWRMKDVDYFVREEAAWTCRKVGLACEKVMKPPRRTFEFGWGKPIHPGDKPCRIKGVK